MNLNPNSHPSREELIARMYQVGEDATLEMHLLTCADCQLAMRALELRRAESVECELPEQALASQRRAILARLGERSRPSLGWLPAVAAAALVLAVAATTYQPSPTPSTKSAAHEVTDESLMAEISALEYAEEPRAAAPIRGLFEEIAVQTGNEDK